MKAEFLDEPELEFGHGGRHVDIRFGLMSFGPLDIGSPRRPQDISVAIIGVITFFRTIFPAKAPREKRSPNNPS